MGDPAAGVRRLIAAGWEIDAHSLTHADLAVTERCRAAREVAGSRRAIRRLFGVTPRFFCYPAGRYDAETIAAVEAAGFEGATTTEFGLASPTGGRFTLARVRVDRGDGADGCAEAGGARAADFAGTHEGDQSRNRSRSAGVIALLRSPASAPRAKGAQLLEPTAELADVAPHDAVSSRA